ncbi:MAG: hypothetical protein VKJ24_22075 [Synechococcales bacterium]|nr:hypothetical protein [Synechococcales bacterium]
MKTLNTTTDLGDLIRYIEPEVLTYLNHQQQFFDRAKTDLLTHYNGLFVWFENGEILDADPDESALFLRSYTPNPNRLLFIAQVLPQEPDRLIRSTRLSQ